MDNPKERRMKRLDELYGEAKENIAEAEVNTETSRETKELPDGSIAVVELPVEKCHPYHNHKFNARRGDFKGLVKSILAMGVTNPIIVRPYQEEYEIIVGHRRHEATVDAGKKTIPAIIRELNDNEAWVIVSETNLFQTSMDDLSHSEKAEVINDYHAALKAQGKRTDLIDEVRNLVETAENKDSDDFRPVGEKTNAAEKTGSQFELSPRTVSRYLRIHKLTDEIKAFVDKEEISVRAGVELSYLSDEHQNYLSEYLEQKGYKVDIKKAEQLRDYELKNKLNEVTMLEILSGVKKERNSKAKGVPPMPKIYNKYFSDTSYNKKEIENIIDEALKLYFKTEESE